MDTQFSFELLNQWFQIGELWISTHIISWQNAIQVLILILIRLFGALLGRPTGRFLNNQTRDRIPPSVLLKSFVENFIRLISLVFSIVLLLICIEIFKKFAINTFLMKLVLNLSLAWVVVQLATSVILSPYWSRFVGIAVWSIAALNIIGVFSSVISFLGDTGISIGQNKLTLLALFQAVIILLVLLKAVNWLNEQFETRLEKVPGLNSSTRLMLTKVTHVTMMVLVFLVVLNSVGLDFSSLALFSGAIGVGVGFGLQKVVGNYISGLILLSDKSVKPGDVIQLADAFGWVRFMGGRYVSVVTRDEKEYLIPNEDLITQQVINWSYSNNIVRQKVKFGVSYGADPHRVISLVLDSLKNVSRILDDPKPACLLKGFGDSSVDFELRFWINDPQHGVSNVSSEVLLGIWDTFKKHNIEIPFPQRDVHLKS